MPCGVDFCPVSLYDNTLRIFLQQSCRTVFALQDCVGFALPAGYSGAAGPIPLFTFSCDVS